MFSWPGISVDALEPSDVWPLGDAGAQAENVKCAGFVTTTNILFPDMEDAMSFQDFFSLIGVDDYEYLSGEDMITGEGWLRFMYRGLEALRIRSWPFQNRRCVLQRSSKYIPPPVASYIKEKALSHL